MERGTKKAIGVGAGLAAAMLIVDRAPHTGTDGPTGKQSAFQDYSCTTEGAASITFARGDTVSERAAKPLAEELGTTTGTALEILRYANPGVNMGKVITGQIFTIPKCAPKSPHQ